VGERGRQRGEVYNDCVRFWEGGIGRQRGEVERECARVWEVDRGIHRGGNRECGRERERET
jgi:hypothetical protein